MKPRKMGYLTGFPSSGMAPITVRLFCVCIAEEGEMNLRQRFVARARARHDRQASARGQVYPMNLGAHACSNERRCGVNEQSYQNVSRETFWYALGLNLTRPRTLDGFE
jgi:hypothetical protein